MCARKHIEQYLDSRTGESFLEIINFNRAYIAATVLLQMTLELLSLSDNMKYSADHFEKAHDRLDKQKKDS